MAADSCQETKVTVASNEKHMIKPLRYFFLLFFPLLVVACADDPDPDEEFPEKADRTVLAYMAGNNNLSSFLSTNIDAMCQGMKGVGGNLIVYFASTDGNPKLYKIGSDGSKTLLQTYEGQNSMDPAVMREVVNEVFEAYPAQSYGMILSSHGDGWLPAATTSKARMTLERPHPNAMITKWFGQDGSTYMNISDMVTALPTGRQLDFLLFDACFMSNVETLYDLRNTAKQIIASPTEVMGNGFPYQTIVPLLFADSFDANQVAKAFVDAYRNATYPSASVAVIQTSELENLATTVQALMAAHPSVTLDLTAIQAYELREPHVYFDMDSYLAQRSGEDLYYQTFREQLAKTITYVDYTPSIYSAFGRTGFFQITHYCGISTFIPQTLSLYTEAYWNTSWAQAVTPQ